MPHAFLDKDGTLVETVSGETFVQHPSDQKLIEGKSDKLIAMEKEGWTFSIVSNQGGVAAGHKTLIDVFDEIRYCMSLLPITINEAFFCPDFEGNRCFMIDECGNSYPMIQAFYEDTQLRYRLSVDGVNSDEVIGKCRKSDKRDGAGMLRLAARHKPSDTQFLMIGDRPEDKVSAEYFGCKFLDANDWVT